METVVSVFNQLKRRIVKTSMVKSTITLYSFRHTFATRCAQQHMPAKPLQYIMGHRDIKTTLQFYVDVTDQDLSQSLDYLS